MKLVVEMMSGFNLDGYDLSNYELGDYKLSDVKYQQGRYWVLKVPTGHEVYKIGIVCSTRVARIGYPKDEEFSFARALTDVQIRIASDI